MRDLINFHMINTVSFERSTNGENMLFVLVVRLRPIVNVKFFPALI